MTGWPLVWVFVGIALAGLVMVICFAIWLWRKATALLREVAELLDRAEQAINLLDEIEAVEHPPVAADSSVTDTGYPQMDRTRQPAT